MKTFFLLTAVVFLTIQVQAQRNEEEMLTQEEAMAENQFPDLPSMEAEGSDTMASGEKRILAWNGKSTSLRDRKLIARCRQFGHSWVLIENMKNMGCLHGTKVGEEDLVTVRGHKCH
uniref:Alpha-defensin N-terminal domain-containing protein n=1 Tax=Vombatus ursinus TaxID=29139 RepID=A0A4X2KKB8_VOMUR